MGSFGIVTDETKIESKINSLTYCSAKAAVSMLTVQYAKGLSNMKVNCVDLGSTATDLNGGRGLQTVAVDFALLNLCQKGDVVVTQDYGVAAMILGKGAYGIHQSARYYTNQNIDTLLMERHLAEK